MRLLVVPKDFPSDEEPHAGIFVLRQIQALQQIGHEVRVLRVVPKAPPLLAHWRRYRSIPAHYTFEGVEVETARPFMPPRMLLTSAVRWQMGAAFARTVRAFAPDIIHAHFIVPTGTLAVARGVPTVLTAHGSDAYDWAQSRADLRSSARFAVRKASVVTAVSRFIADRVRALGRDTVEVVYNGADAATFAPGDRAQARRTLDVDPLRSVIVYAGRIERTKGIFELADALARIGERAPLLLLGGAGPHEADLRERLRANGVEHRFLGMLSHVQIARLFAAADAVALPSYSEGLPAVVCEAMLAGRVVIATPVGGIPEIVQDGVSGRLVPVCDVGALTNAIVALTGDPAGRDRMQRAALAFARAHLTWAINARAYDVIYHSLLV